jgi:hypothetical protein
VTGRERVKFLGLVIVSAVVAVGLRLWLGLATAAVVLLAAAVVAVLIVEGRYWWSTWRDT